MLDIFHSLHCLNEIRMTLNADYYGVPHERLNTTEERTKIHLGWFPVLHQSICLRNLTDTFTQIIALNTSGCPFGATQT